MDEPRKRQSTPAQRKAVAKYNKSCTVQYSFRLNLNTDQKLIEKLSEVPSMAGYIKDLIRADIERTPD